MADVRKAETISDWLPAIYGGMGLREQRALELLYGISIQDLEELKNLSVEQVGMLCKMTPQRVLEIEARALQKIEEVKKEGRKPPFH